ncbi:MAG: hypothetical protein HC899_39675 [Leptolyngbyaceae cyanobacterium SM1_4_3]|nr:hypothetical protein [Leptolyngbyaceae cyanobacterium SM1_4_3]
MTRSSQTNARVEQLTSNLELSARQANDAFLLQADPLFQQTLKNYSDITANLAVLESRFTADAPTVVARTGQATGRARIAFKPRAATFEPVCESKLTQFS